MLSDSIALIIGASYFGVEAYRAEGKTARLVLAALSVAFVLAGIFLPLLTAAYPKVGAFIAAVFDDPSSWFILFLGLFFVLRPFWQGGASHQAPEMDQAGDALLEQAVRDLESNVASLAAQVQLIGDARARVEKTEASISAICDIIDGLEASKTSLEENLIRISASNAGDLEGLRQSIAGVQKEYVAHQSLNADALRSQFDNIYLALAAVGHWERIIALGNELEALGTILSKPTENKEFSLNEDDWATWEQAEEGWREKLGAWLELADRYQSGTSQKVLSTPEGLYRSGNWTISDSQFPASNTSNAVHAYKSFRIIYTNWKNEWGGVNWRVAQAAFCGRANEMIEGEK